MFRYVPNWIRGLVLAGSIAGAVACSSEALPTPAPTQDPNLGRIEALEKELRGLQTKVAQPTPTTVPQLTYTPTPRPTPTSRPTATPRPTNTPVPTPLVSTEFYIIERGEHPYSSYSGGSTIATVYLGKIEECKRLRNSPGRTSESAFESNVRHNAERKNSGNGYLHPKRRELGLEYYDAKFDGEGNLIIDAFNDDETFNSIARLMPEIVSGICDPLLPKGYQIISDVNRIPVEEGRVIERYKDDVTSFDVIENRVVDDRKAIIKFHRTNGCMLDVYYDDGDKSDDDGDEPRWSDKRYIDKGCNGFSSKDKDTGWIPTAIDNELNWVETEDYMAKDYNSLLAQIGVLEKIPGQKTNYHRNGSYNYHRNGSYDFDGRPPVGVAERIHPNRFINGYLREPPRKLGL